MANPAGSDFKEVEEAAEARRTRTPATVFRVFFSRRPRTSLSLRPAHLIDHAPQARLELVAIELVRWPHIEDRRRSLVEALADDVENRIGLACLRPGDADNAPVEARHGRAAERHHGGRQVRVARARQAGLGAVDAVGLGPCVGRGEGRGPNEVPEAPHQAWAWIHPWSNIGPSRASCRVHVAGFQSSRLLVHRVGDLVQRVDDQRFELSPLVYLPGVGRRDRHQFRAHLGGGRVQNQPRIIQRNELSALGPQLQVETLGPDVLDPRVGARSCCCGALRP